MKVLTFLLLFMTVAKCHESFKVIFQWNTTDVVWPSEEDRKYAIHRGTYVPANNAIAGIKFWKGKMYLTVPRWRDGVPVTLGVTSATPVNGETAPNLEPFPDWNMQKIDDCNAFQLVQSMEIDPRGRMWVLDTGRTSALSPETKFKCPTRLVILDLEKEGEILRIYQFPEDVATPGKSYLNDIVLDHEDGGMAYITDSGETDPGIIVYSLRNNTSWKVRHDSMKAKSEAVGFMVAKIGVIMPVNVDGIALSPVNTPERLVYYSPLSSFHLYSIPTSALKSNPLDVDRYVREVGRKGSQTDGMIMSSTGVLYFGLLADDAVAMWDTKRIPSFTTGQRVISRDHTLMQWPDTFAFDEDGYLWCVTNALQNLLNNRVNVSAPNYRAIRMRVGVKNYQYYDNGTAPEWPDVTAGVGRYSSDSGLVLGLALLFLVLHFTK